MIFTKIFKFIWSIVSKGGLKIRGVFSLMNNKAVYFKTFKAKIVNLDSGLNSCLNTTKHGFIIISKSVRKKVVSLSNWINTTDPKLLLLASFIFFACIVALRLRERLPSAIFPMSNLQWYIYLELLLINLLALSLLIRSLSGSKPSTYFAKLAKKVEAVRSNIQSKINNEYMDLLYYNYNIAYYLQYLLYLNYKFFSELHYRTQKAYYYIFLVIPKIIVCFAFSYDVLIANYFLYFYKVAWLLLVPLAFRMFVYSLKALYTTEFPAIELTYDIERMEEEQWPSWAEFKIKIGVDQEKDENQTVLLHVYNHVKNVLSCLVEYPPRDKYTYIRQYLIYRRIWFTIKEIETFQALNKHPELLTRLIYIVNIIFIVLKSKYNICIIF